MQIPRMEISVNLKRSEEEYYRKDQSDYKMQNVLLQ